ncbi:MAG: OB-fold domain-containing protein [Acidimicrobiales bacterium]
MRGILSWGVHVPYWRLDRSSIAAVAGAGGGVGRRSVASYDQDTTTLGVEAAREAWRSAPAGVQPNALWFSTVAPAYLDKTNATAIHAALDLERWVGAYDVIGSVRSGMGALRSALQSTRPAIVVAADIRTGLPASPDESAGGDGAVALLIGGADDGPVLAELVSWSSATEEFLDRWRTPGEIRSRVWEERFGEQRYAALAGETWSDALRGADLGPDRVDHLIVTGTHERANASVARKLAAQAKAELHVVDTLASSVGNTGAAHPGLLLASTLEQAQPNQVIALVVLADGAETVILRTTPTLAAYKVTRPVAVQIDSGAVLSYGKYLSWRGLLTPEPPRRPEPARPSASASGRSRGWKFAFVGSKGPDGTVHLPPTPGGAPYPMAQARGHILTFTVDRLAYSPSPPVVFAVVDFDGGGRLPVELTDIDASRVAVGDEVEMTFRRLFSADGIHNYFWKASPVRTGTSIERTG